MTAISPLVADPNFELAFRWLSPEPERPRKLLVLLHGVGGNETNLAALGAGIGTETLVVLPRAGIELGSNAFAWFRVTFLKDGPSIVANEAEASRRTLIRFIGQLQRAYGIEASRTIIGGFSQGGILSASVALSSPETVAGFAVLAGRVLPELEPQIVERERLLALRGYIAHGRDDDKLPVDWAHRADDWLTRLGVEHEMRLYSAGHFLNEKMQTDFRNWLTNWSAPWNRA